jgi:small Trp-rich protein
MPLVVIGVLLFLMKILDFDPVARWSWFWVLTPFILVFIWWEVIAPMVGWDKKVAEKKMKDDAREAEEAKKKNRGF